MFFFDVCKCWFITKANFVHFFGESFLLPFDFSNFEVQNKEKFCPFFWGSFCCCSILAIFGSEQAEVLSIFLGELLLHFDVFLGAGQGEMLSTFFGEVFVFDFCDVGFKAKGNSVHFSWQTFGCISIFVVLGAEQGQHLSIFLGEFFAAF